MRDKLGKYFSINDLFNQYLNRKRKSYNELNMKGGLTMETKSRYEAMADLEEKKRSLILERDSFDSKLQTKKKELKELKRELEDKEEEIKEFEESIEDQKKTISELIKSTDESLKRFEGIGKKK